MEKKQGFIEQFFLWKISFWFLYENDLQPRWSVPFHIELLVQAQWFWALLNSDWLLDADLGKNLI